MDQQEILGRISAMVDDEKRLRAALADGTIDAATERERLADVERALDQCWDLLRQRRAKAEFGENPDEASVRPSAEVEGYES
ncbi:DUF2630 family protein [Streptomyces xanthii]|uniref:DUF2630 family protein n=1 Tax=Streptomyces xanthii TaxID=2768069 RepID=A0A7H1BG55_9ACTN|nr:DUF2630 family protein [Streptomyces xanthii]QNS07710.1 DUF2630 family protein [Streptomyces xanthii]